MADTSFASEPVSNPEQIHAAHAAAHQNTTSSIPADAGITPGTNTQAAKDTAASYAQQAGTSLQNAAQSAGSYASSTVDSVKNSQTVQELANGPVGSNVKDQAAKTNSEFQNLANARSTPTKPAATGQPLTHYHSFFYKLLSWDNPRATAIAFATTVTFIFMARYLNLLHYIFRFTYIILGITASLEVAGKLVFSNGLAAQVRPRKYWTIPRESLEASLEDVEQLLNFFVIETQRIVFAENVYVTGAAFVAAFVSYYLIKILPFWGLTLVGTCVLYLAPLLYVTNKEAIDGMIEHTGKVIDTQAAQLKDLTAQHTKGATDTLKNYTNEYTAKAQQYVGSKPQVTASDLPSTPSTNPAVSSANTTTAQPKLSEPLI